eukprot:TRINITY_DN8620_c0_g1_i4.p2 TRINITY_DN8620_c0_g1~~TRINITY_DN8620_c0_g1_i4.p2  ORF type:complete len:243 (-),score=-2.41 TRINITY_DN8620_c0_g1_i4:469-1197(-)
MQISITMTIYTQITRYILYQVVDANYRSLKMQVQNANIKTIVQFQKMPQSFTIMINTLNTQKVYSSGTQFCKLQKILYQVVDANYRSLKMQVQNANIKTIVQFQKMPQSFTIVINTLNTQKVYSSGTQFCKLQKILYQVVDANYRSLKMQVQNANIKTIVQFQKMPQSFTIVINTLNTQKVYSSGTQFCKLQKILQFIDESPSNIYANIQVFNINSSKLYNILISQQQYNKLQQIFVEINAT